MTENAPNYPCERCDVAGRCDAAYTRYALMCQAFCVEEPEPEDCQFADWLDERRDMLALLRGQ